MTVLVWFAHVLFYVCAFHCAVIRFVSVRTNGGTSRFRSHLVVGPTFLLESVRAAGVFLIWFDDLNMCRGNIEILDTPTFLLWGALPLPKPHHRNCGTLRPAKILNCQDVACGCVLDL